MTLSVASLISETSGGLRTLMLVSAFADPWLRSEVRAGTRPCPEYLSLERDYGVELLDWSRIGERGGTRSKRRSLHHVAAALRQLKNVDAVFSDGEHVGLPLALAMQTVGVNVPHLMIGHHLTSRLKRPLVRSVQAHGGVTRILVHSRHQLGLANTQLGIPLSRLAFVPYHVDTNFWSPQGSSEEGWVVAAGREHRDYQTLVRACAGLDLRVFIASGSVHSPTAPMTDVTGGLPAGVESGFATYTELRAWYARASVVVVPLMPNDFQAGVTTLLEAMAMGKATIVSATDGQRDLVEDGVTGLMVAPGDAGELRRAVLFLMANPSRRARIGEAARRAATSRYSLEVYTRELAKNLQELATGARVAA